MLTTVCKAQNRGKIGVGILTIDIERYPVLKLYSDTNSNVPNTTIFVKKVKQDGVVVNTVPQLKGFTPEALWLDYYIFLLRVEKVSPNWFKVFVSDHTTFWLGKSTKGVRFDTWPVFLKSHISALFKLDGYDLDIKLAPSDKAKTIKKMEEKDCFEVLEVRGDWMRIRTNTGLECSETKRPVRSGWIRWRKADRLQVGYTQTC